MIEFSIAAARDEDERNAAEKVVEVPIEDKVYHATKPTFGQIVLLNARGEGGRDFSIVFKFIEGIMGAEARAHIERLVWANRIDYSDLIGGSDKNPTPLLDAIIEEFTERPTTPSSESSPSPATAGRKSTGRSRGEGSVPSETSPSTSS